MEVGKILFSRRVADGYVIAFDGSRNSYAIELLVALGGEGQVRLVPSAFEEKQMGWWISDNAASGVFSVFENGREVFCNLREQK